MHRPDWKERSELGCPDPKMNVLPQRILQTAHLFSWAQVREQEVLSCSGGHPPPAAPVPSQLEKEQNREAEKEELQDPIIECSCSLHTSGGLAVPPDNIVPQGISLTPLQAQPGTFLN